MTKRFTLRVRLAIWTALILLIFGSALVVIINVLASMVLPEVIHEVMIQEDDSITYYNGDEVFQSFTSTDATDDLTIVDVVSTPSIDPAAEVSLSTLRIISVASLGAVVLFGSIGVYWLAKRALRPLQALNHSIQHVQAANLAERLPLDGPEDEIYELKQSFNTMLNRLQEAFDQQDQFVSNAAHELRTPLAVLQTNLEVVRDDPQATKDDYKHMGNVFQRTVLRLNALINDLLVLASRRQVTDFEHFAVNTVLEEVVTDLTPYARERKVVIEQNIGENVKLKGNPVLINRVFSNLIENAIRYNREGGWVKIKAEQLHRHVRIAIQDNGPGIPHKDQQHLFEPFYRIDSSRSRHRGGAGLGLAISRMIVHKHGGKLHLESEPDRGSTFFVELPLDLSD